jgi:hypothetical protein
MSNKSPYADKIAALVTTKHDLRHVEAFMRVEHVTLDHLSEAQFRACAAVATSCVDECDAETCEALAASYGL